MMKLVHPQDIISRVFMLDYLREIPADHTVLKADANEKKKLFYTFIYEVDGEEKTKYDYNWEELLFYYDLPLLEQFLMKFLDECETIDKKREVVMQMRLNEVEQEKAVADINVMDLAQTAINKAQDPTHIYGSE